MVNVLILLAVSSYAPFFQAVVRSTLQSFERDQALTLAEAGITHARWEILRNNAANLGSPPAADGRWTDPTATGCDDEVDGGSDSLLYGLAVTSCRRFTATLNGGDLSGQTVGAYTVWVANLGSPLVRLVARGAAPNAAAPLATQTISLDLAQASTFRYAAFAARNILIGSLTRAVIDSWDGATGPYSAAVARAIGNVGTNGDTDVNSVDLTINSTSDIRGTGFITPGDRYSTPLTQPSGGVSTISDVSLPHVNVPAALETLPITTTLGVGNTAIVEESGAGDFKVKGTYTCDQSLRVRSVLVSAGGTLRMTDNCQLLVDCANDDGSTYNPYYTPGQQALDTSGGGKILKVGTGRTQIFIRNRGFDFDGPGIVWDAAIPEADRRPVNLQIYATCKTPPCSLAGLAYNNLKQNQPFYGVVYLESANQALNLLGGIDSDGLYYGAFITTGTIKIDGDYKIGKTSRTAFIHYDESAAALVLDGSGNTSGAYQTVSESWSLR